jgi:acyl-CoA reductase-like NAD-dependent aldehyde dehydrogenase
MSSPDFATVAPRSSSTPTTEVDEKIARLARKKHEWPTVGTRERARLLDRAIDAAVRVAPEWVLAACAAKGIDPSAPLSGEEWLSGPVPLIRNMRLLREAMDAEGQPRVPNVRTREGGQRVARVFPTSLLDALLIGGVTGEVWLEPGAEATQGKIYRDKRLRAPGPKDGKLGLVLGAGNISSIGPMDALYKLFVDDEVVLIKTNPVNAYLQPFWEESLRPFVDAGYLAIVRGGAEVGRYLTEHREVDSIHITGSDRTHDAIVWGSSEAEQKRNKAAGTPANTKPITSELGAVTPCIVVPGAWTEAELDYQARHVASMVAHNASFNCNACKVVVTARGWRQREDFLARVERELAAAPQRRAYYPGAQERYSAFLAKYPAAKPLGAPRTPTVVPWTVLPDVPAADGEYALTNEAFCGVLAEVTLDAHEPGEFLEAATRFANEQCWGTLSCMILIRPEEQRRHAASFEKALSELRYGGIAVNAWAGLVYALVTTTWGAFPEHPLDDIRSGRGVVHNALLLDHPQKSVVRAPFIARPIPVWFVGHRTLNRIGPLLTKVEAKPDLGTVVSLVAAALRG